MSAAGSIGKFLLKNKGSVINAGFGTWFASQTYQDEREQGAGAVSAIASSAVDFSLPMMMSMKKYIGLQALAAAPGAAVSGYMAANRYRRDLGRQSRQRAFQNAQFNDTEEIHTMRQAGMAIAQRSKFNVQQAMLGNEAKYMMK